MVSQNNLTYRQILRYFRDRAESVAEILPHNENSTSRLGVQLVGLLNGLLDCHIKDFAKTVWCHGRHNK